MGSRIRRGCTQCGRSEFLGKVENGHTNDCVDLAAPLSGLPRGVSSGAAGGWHVVRICDAGSLVVGLLLHRIPEIH